MNHEALKLACLVCNGMGFIDGVGAKCRRCDGRGVTLATTQPAEPASVQELHKENPYYPATYIGEGWQDGFDGKALASTLEPYTRGYAEGKADARAIKQTHSITPPSASPNPPRSD